MKLPDLYLSGRLNNSTFAFKSCDSTVDQLFIAGKQYGLIPETIIIALWRDSLLDGHELVYIGSSHSWLRPTDGVADLIPAPFS